MTRNLLFSLACLAAIGLVGCDAAAPTDAPDETAAASAESAHAIAASFLSASHVGNVRIDLSWSAVSGATHYTLNRTNTGYQGTIPDGPSNVGTATSATDYPYHEPDFDSFVPNAYFGFACYAVTAHNAQGQSATSRTRCYGVEGNGGGF